MKTLITFLSALVISASAQYPDSVQRPGIREEYGPPSQENEVVPQPVAFSATVPDRASGPRPQLFQRNGFSGHQQQPQQFNHLASRNNFDNVNQRHGATQSQQVGGFISHSRTQGLQQFAGNQQDQGFSFSRNGGSTLNSGGHVNGLNDEAFEGQNNFASPQGFSSPVEQTFQQEQRFGREPRIHKHVYVHVAPEEPKEITSNRPRSPPPQPEKHYKIIFIKAPEPPSFENGEIELPPAPEQKTLVYVLLKKPTFGDGISFPTPAPTPPSKPEVYFIRYKGGKSKENVLQDSTPEHENDRASSSQQAFGGQRDPSIGGQGSLPRQTQTGGPRSQYGLPSQGY